MARTLKWPKPFQDVSVAALATDRCMWHKPSYICLIVCYSSRGPMSRTCRRRRCFAPLTLTARCCTSPPHAVWSVIIPHIKQASSRAIKNFLFAAIRLRRMSSPIPIRQPPIISTYLPILLPCGVYSVKMPLSCAVMRLAASGLRYTIS